MRLDSLTRTMTYDEFVAFALDADNADKNFEFINGEVVEVMPGRASVSNIRDILAYAVRHFCVTHAISCYTSGEAGAYRVGDNVLVPDFAYQTEPFTGEYPEPQPPLWMVEIISPTDKPHLVRAKRLVYLAAGVLYWEVYPEAQSVDVYALGMLTQTRRAGETLDGGTVLPGFTVAVAALFA